MGFNVTSGQSFIFNNGTSGHVAHISGSGVDSKVNGFLINGTRVIDSSKNLTNIGTVSSGAITSSGQITSGGTIQADLLKGSTSANNNYINFNDDTNTYGDS